ncbi:GNAT family N-acetyltransferase [Radiobacillus kanasensis]|uniref:GNAT family N-acetyltransferase n=1 Tax=Radiobacillus kanasensis TaxID=2844358 RepID=UPI001E3E39CB|nr:GNAT family N-acetyltransferase [Radiobacillus kanasensis]UFU00208.1 GNAT family N-acetyltransferase [Radiobacillus kanasensis]
MSLRLVSINKDLKDINNIKNLYKNSFPVNEQIPFWYLLYKSKKNYVDLFALYDNELFVGFTCLITNKDITFVLYLAIDNSHRSRGYGGKALSKIKECYPNNRVVLNIEEVNVSAKDYQQRMKRKSFYLKNGFKNSRFKLKEVNNNMFEVLVNKGDITKEEYLNLFKKFTGRTIFVFVKPKLIT